MAEQVRADAIGQRIRARRELRGWSVRFLADRAGISSGNLSRIERGLRSANNRYLIADLAAALECSILDLTGQPYPPADRELEAAHARVTRLRTALVEAAPDEPARTDHQPLPMAQLEELSTVAAARYASYDYAALADVVTRSIPDLHAHGVLGDRRAIELLVRANYAASAVFKNLGYPGEAWLAAERCRDAARWLDDPVALAVAEFCRSQAAVRCVGYRHAATITERAIDALRPHLAAPDALVALGMLHLSSIYSSMGQHRPDEALDHATEAQQIADRTGETTAWSFYFGPTNAGIWRVGLEIDRGRPGAATTIAQGLHVGDLPPFRQVAFHLDLARALSADHRHHERAVRALLTAERIAPQHVRSSPSARETAHDLRESARRAAVGSALRGLCERVGLPA